MPEQSELDAIDLRIVGALQGGFPVCERPFARAAEGIGISEDCLLSRLDSLLRRRVLTRFGPMFQIERIGGAFVLAAMHVPAEEWDRVVAQINAMPEVAHNYRRDHALNMWFVLATEIPEGIAHAIEAIERVTGLSVLAFPKEREYFVGLKLFPGQGA